MACYLWANEGLAPYGRVHVERDLAAKLRVIGSKLMVDGAFGSRGAALLEPYSDAPEERGLLQLSPEVARLLEVERAGLQPANATGDAGNRALRARARAGAAAPSSRHRSVHA